MNALTEFLNAKDAERDRFYCPCCKDRLHQSDMDLANEWKHSEAMRARYGAACCKGCTDDHLMTEDGVCMPRKQALYSHRLDMWFSGRDAADEVEAAA